MAYSAGLYFGLDFIDLVVIDSAKQKPKIVKSFRMPIYEEGVVHLQRDRILAVTLTLKKVFDTLNIKPKDITFSLPQEEIIVRRFVMPYLPVDERESAVKFEAQRYLPFKLDDTISDFYVINESKNARKMEIVFVAIVSQVMDKYISIFKQLKIKIDIADIVPFALLRVLASCGKIAEDDIKVLIYTEKNSRGSVIIIKDNSVYLVREVGFMATKELFFESVLSNVRLSIDYFKRETKETAVPNLLICGDENPAELETYLKENMTSANTDRFTLTDEFEGLDELSSRQLITLGLAMASSAKVRSRINLWNQVPKISMPRGVTENRPLLLEGVVLIVILAMIQFGVNANVTLLKKKIAPIRAARMALLKNVNMETSQAELLEMESKTKSQIAFLRNLAGERRMYLTKKLNCFGSLVPEGAWIESFNFIDEIDRDRSLGVTGLIYSDDEKNGPVIANEMLTKMKQTEDFYSGYADVKLNSLTRTPAYSRTALAFVIECKGPPLTSSGMIENPKDSRKGVWDIEEMFTTGLNKDKVR